MEYDGYIIFTFIIVVVIINVIVVVIINVGWTLIKPENKVNSVGAYAIPYAHAYMIGQSSAIKAILNNLDTFSEKKEENRKVLQKLVAWHAIRSHDAIDRISVFDADSRIIATSDGINVGSDRSHRNYITMTLSGEAVQTALFNSGNGNYYALTTSPVYDANNVVIGGVSIQQFIHKQATPME